MSDNQKDKSSCGGDRVEGTELLLRSMTTSIMAFPTKNCWN